VSLRIEQLSFGYDDTVVLDSIDLQAESGELVGLLGPNGSGKSTLLRCTNRLLDPDEGTVTVAGDRVGKLTQSERARRIGYVPQSESRAFPATVFETILQGRRPHGGWKPSRRDRTAAEQMLERLGISAWRYRSLEQLSGGQRQIVNLGRALVGDPDVLLLDEPTSALDLKHQLAVMNLVTEHVDKADLAGVMAMHNLNLASRYADRIALLAEGTIHAVGEPDILTPELLEEVYGVRAAVHQPEEHRLIEPKAPAAGDAPGAIGPEDPPERR